MGIKAHGGQVPEGEHVICALSGGVDSTVAATLVHQVLGDRLHCVFVDNGLLRFKVLPLLLLLHTEKATHWAALLLRRQGYRRLQCWLNVCRSGTVQALVPVPFPVYTACPLLWTQPSPAYSRTWPCHVCRRQSG